MGANDDLEGKKTHLAGFYIHTISGQNIPKPPIVRVYQIPTPLFFHSSGEIFITEVGVLISSFNVSREKRKDKSFRYILVLYYIVVHA